MKRGVALCLSILLISVLLMGCRRKVGDIETASIETAREYVKEAYNKNITDIILLEQFYQEEEKKTEVWDGAVFWEEIIPAQTKTSYRAYSPEDDMYFFIYHNTAQKFYQNSLSEGKSSIKYANEKIRWAKEYFGEDYIGVAVEWHWTPDDPKYYATTIKTEYDSKESNVKASYNSFIKDFKTPYRYVHYNMAGGVGLSLSTDINIYVRCSLAELQQKDEELQERYHRGIFTLIFASDGIYNSYRIKSEEEIITDIPE